MEYQNQDAGYALDWEGEVSDEGGFVLLEPGVYPFVVGGLSKERYEGGSKIGPCPRARITLGVITDGGMVDVQDSMLLHSKTAWRVAKFFEALGFQKNPETGKVPMAWNQIEGRQGLVRIKTRKYMSNGEERQTNEVDEYLVPDGPAQAQQAPQPVAYQQPQLMPTPPATPQAAAQPGWSM